MTGRAITRVRWLVGALLITAAGLFAIGASVEHNSDKAADKTAVVTTIREGTAAAEGSEAAEAAEAAQGAGTAEPADSHSEAGESHATALGVNLESTPLVVLAVIASIALAVATWRSNNRLLLLITAAFAGLFAILDIAEFVHQIDRSKAGLAALAAIIAVLHAGAALLAGQRSLDDADAR